MKHYTILCALTLFLYTSSTKPMNEFNEFIECSTTQLTEFVETTFPESPYITLTLGTLCALSLVINVWQYVYLQNSNITYEKHIKTITGENKDNRLASYNH